MDQATGGVAVDALEGLANRLLTAGASGFVALGTTGEPASLTEAEQRVVVEVAAHACREHDTTLMVGGSDPELMLEATALGTSISTHSGGPQGPRPRHAAVDRGGPGC